MIRSIPQNGLLPMATGYVYDSHFLEHDLAGHPENSGRLRAIMAHLQESGLLEQLTPIAPAPVDPALLYEVHAEEYCRRVQRMAEAGGGFLDADTYVTPCSYDVALLAAGGVIGAVRAVLAGQVRHAYALVRPPGHHAGRARGMGFCLFNNVALAAHAARSRAAVARLLIIDFDVHHGNGTQEIFYEDDSVLYFSTHEYPFYPGTGHWHDIGAGRGAGYTINVPLPHGVGDEGFRLIFRELLRPAAERFAPDFILVSAGYDAHWREPLAALNLSLHGYAWMAQFIQDLAEDLCAGRLVFALEGGYNLDVLAIAVANTFRVLEGLPASTWDDPFGRPAGEEKPIGGFVRQLRAFHHLD